MRDALVVRRPAGDLKPVDIEQVARRRLAEGDDAVIVEILDLLRLAMRISVTTGPAKSAGRSANAAFAPS